MAVPAPTQIETPVCATGVRIPGGRIVFLGWAGSTRTLRLVAGDGGVQDLVRFGRVRPGAFDADGGRLAWAARDCGGGEAIFTARLAEAPLSAGSITCRARFGSGLVPVRRGLAAVSLSCPRGCGGELTLRRMRLERRGSLEALAKIVTRNRAGDRQARSRSVTLVAH